MVRPLPCRSDKSSGKIPRMQKRLYVAGLHPRCGKTVVILGIAAALRQAGICVGYCKPIGRSAGIHASADRDANLMRQRFALPEPEAWLNPFARAAQDGPLPEAARMTIMTTLPQIAGDFVIIEGAPWPTEGESIGLSAMQLPQTLDCAALLVFDMDTPVFEPALFAARMLGTRLSGVILNKVKPTQTALAREMSDALACCGVKTWGLIPYAATLASPTAREVADTLEATFLAGESKADVLLEHFAVGAMDAEAAMEHFGANHTQAVITGSHRADIILAALESGVGLILTGGRPPGEVILRRARQDGQIAMITRLDTLSAVKRIEALKESLWLGRPERANAAEALIEGHFPVLRFFETVA